MSRKNEKRVARRQAARFAAARARQTGVALGSTGVNASDAAAHCGCFGTIDGVPAFAVKPTVCGHYLEVERDDFVTLAGRVVRQVTYSKRRRNPIRSIAIGMRVMATSHVRIKNIEPRVSR